MTTKIFLLADDDMDDTELFREALEAVDPTVVCYYASNGEEVLDILSREEKPHLIFLDVNMPGMNGWQCLKAIKTNENFKNIPVVMYSTSAHQREVAIAQDLGALCFFTKPYNFKELKRILHIIVDNINGDFFKSVSEFNYLKPGEKSGEATS